MVLPLLPLIKGAAALIGLAAGGAAVKAAADSHTSSETRARATQKYTDMEARIGREIEQTNHALAKVQGLCVEVIGGPLKRVIDIADRVHSGDNFMQAPEARELGNPLQRLRELKPSSISAAEALKTVAGAAVTGAAAGAGTFATVAAFGTASTGTAISSLAGAAATKATWAALGGGAISAGGGGVAAGMATVGGVVAAPALAILAFSWASRAEKQLTEAVQYEAEVDIAIEMSKTDITKMLAIRRRCNVVRKAIRDLVNHAVPEIERMEEILDAHGEGKVPYSALSPEEADLYKTVLFLGTKLYELTEVDIEAERAAILAEAGQAPASEPAAATATTP